MSDVLLLHAGIADRRMWAPQIEVLSGAGHRVLAPDLPGFGNAALDCLFLLRESRLRRLRPVPVAEPSADQDEPLDELEAGERKLERNSSPEGAADDGGRGVEVRRRDVDVRDLPRRERRVPVAGEIGRDDAVPRRLERLDLRRPHAPVGDPGVEEQDAHPSANNGRTSSSNASRSQLATTAGVTARTDAVRGTSIARATSPK